MTEIENPLFIYYHIPKTGGTTLIWSIGSHFDRQNDRYLKHYHWMNTQNYLQANIPLLERRTVEQQKQLKFLTGHGTYSMAHFWLKVRKTPLFFATFRNPIDRLLSSFNYRHGISTLVQDDVEFTYIDPPMDPHAKWNKKTAKDYDTLYEWYCDAGAERNLQCKWMLKCWHVFIDGNFVPWSEVTKYSQPEQNPDIWPTWFETLEIDGDLYNIIKGNVDALWWAGTNDTLTDDIPALCKQAGIEHVQVDNRHRSGVDFPRYWTRQEVEAQPDYHKLVEAEQWDIALYNHVKLNCKRPF